MKAIWFIVLLFAVSSNCFAQSSGLGVRIGFNASSLITENGILKEIFGFTAGGNLGIHGYHMFSDRLGIEGGVQLTQGGVSNSGGQRVVLNYIALPISARMKWSLFTLNVGAQPAVLAFGKSEGANIRDDIRLMDFMVFVTPGVEFQNGVTISGVTSLGLLDVYESDQGATTNNLIFQLSIGYNFIKIDR